MKIHRRCIATLYTTRTSVLESFSRPRSLFTYMKDVNWLSLIRCRIDPTHVLGRAKVYYITVHLAYSFTSPSNFRYEYAVHVYKRTCKVQIMYEDHLVGRYDRSMGFWNGHFARLSIARGEVEVGKGGRWWRVLVVGGGLFAAPVGKVGRVNLLVVDHSHASRLHIFCCTSSSSTSA